MSDISIMPSSITPLAPHRDHTVTPSGADAWFHCPRRATLVTKAETSPAMQRGSAIHDALRLDGRRDLAHRPRLSPEDIVLHGCSDTTLTDDPDFFAQATSCVAGARHFLEEYELTLVRAEQYVRSAYRDVGGAPGLRVRFSGRIDAVARTSGGELVLIDYKTGNSVPA